MAITGMWHASWTVESMARTLPFYVDLLGMEVVHVQVQDNEYTRQLVGIPGAKLKVVLLRIPRVDPGPSGHLIELVEYLAPKGVKLDTRACNVGAAHFAFLTENVLEMHQRLRDAGVHFISPPVAITAGRNAGGYTCYLHDPDGYTIELLQPPDRSRQAEQSVAPSSTRTA
jgi:catechol 2,3-dioxygenase-like lactoylglutathione lyase family enzyme